MGAGQSNVAGATKEAVFYPESGKGTVQFSPELIAQMADPSNSTAPSPARQSSLDDHIRAQLARSLSNLREQEAALAKSLASELAASNTTKEASSSAAGTTSAILKGDLDEVRAKVERVQKKVANVESGEVGQAREGVKACLLKNKDRPLDCWKETEQFKAAVSRLEQDFVKSLA